VRSREGGGRRVLEVERRDVSLRRWARNVVVAGLKRGSRWGVGCLRWGMNGGGVG
jgi:hypothetical protein